MAGNDKTKKQLLEELIAVRRSFAEAETERRLLRTLFDTLPDRLYFKDAQGRFLFVNRAVVAILGAESAEDVVGKSDFDFYPQELAERFHSDEQQFLQAGQDRVNMEQPSQDMKSGRTGWSLTSKIILRDAEGEVTGLMGIGRDITELKEAQAESQRQLEVIQKQQEVLRQLSTPIIPIMDNIIVMPLIGVIDSARAGDIMRALLTGVSEHRAEIVIIDITGVPMVDTGVADYLNRAIKAARLKGTQTIVTGISDAVAETIVNLGIDWSDIDTLRSVQAGLKVAMQRLNAA